MSRAKLAVQKLFAEADVQINGARRWDIHVKDERFYRTVLRGGTLAFGETYMAGWWDSDALDELVARLLSSNARQKIGLTPGNALLFLETLLRNVGSKSKAFEVGEHHYDLGNDLFEKMLDKRMTYTCGYWRTARNLEDAEEAKLDLVCKKIGLKPGQTVLDIGCGWGSFMKFAAEKYGANVVGVTVSKEQMKLGQELCKGLPVEFRLQDYRDVEGMFDHVVSIGMFEQVGYKNFRSFMQLVSDHLKDDGLFLLHTIGSNVSARNGDPWLEKYIFPNGMLPSVAQLGKSFEKLFVMEDWHNFGADYDKTLLAWIANFEKHWPELSAKYGETFHRMWRFYILSCAGAFRSRTTQLWQIVLSKDGVKGGHLSVR